MERLMETTPRIENRLERLKDLVTGFEIGRVFLAALELDIFSELDEPAYAENLASRIDTRPGPTEKLLDVLAGLGLLSKEKGRYFTSPGFAPFLVKDSPYFGRFLKPKENHLHNLVHLEEVLRNGTKRSQDDPKHRFDKEAIDWMARISLLGRLQATVKQVKALAEFPRATKLIDLGCGHGLFGICFAQENPNLQVVLFDRPDVIPATRTYIERYDAGNQVRAMSGDYTVDDFGNGYDIVFEACSFGGSLQETKSFFDKVANALNPDGLFIRLTFTIDNDRKGPLEPLLWELKNNLAENSPRPMQTNSGLSSLLSESGMHLEKVVEMSQWCMNPMRLFISRKKEMPTPIR